MSKKSVIDAIRGYMNKEDPLPKLNPSVAHGRLRQDEYCPICFDRAGELHPDKFIAFCSPRHLAEYMLLHPDQMED